MCFKKDSIIRSEYVNGSGGSRRMFFRKEGTVVEHRQGDCGYISDNTIVVQWGGSPEYDSGYYARYFPATMAGLKAAHAAMDELN